MRAELLTDTGPLYALVDVSDQYHQRARQELEALGTSYGVAVLTSTVLETHSLLLKRLGTKVALHWFEELSNGASILNPSREDYLAASKTLRKFPDQQISYFDATLFEVSRATSFSVWTFDHHFDVLGASVWRSGS